MLDLPTQVLVELDKSGGEVTSLLLSSVLHVEVQRVVGAIKSLEALGQQFHIEQLDYIYLNIILVLNKILLNNIEFTNDEIGLQEM